MTSRRIARILVVVCLLSSAALLFLIINLRTRDHQVTSLRQLASDMNVQYLALEAGHSERMTFIVNTPGCKIPNIEPFDASVRHLVTPDNTSTVQCANATPPITYVFIIN